LPDDKDPMYNLGKRLSRISNSDKVLMMYNLGKKLSKILNSDKDLSNKRTLRGGEMFGLFGASKKTTLIRELLEQRMRKSGFDELDYRLQIKRLSSFKIMGTPEALIVTVAESVINGQQKLAPLTAILRSLENHRKRIGHIETQFNDIIKIAEGSNAGESVCLYCSYRISLEHDSLLDQDEVEEVLEKVIPEIANW
jgi:hypothetical protein